MKAFYSRIILDMKRIYLDACCLNRPFDDQEQARIHLESEAVRFILKHIGDGDFVWIGSDALEYEIHQAPDVNRRTEMLFTMDIISETVESVHQDAERIAELVRLGFGPMDAVHLMCAEKAKVDVLLTTDDNFKKKGIMYSDKLKVRIENPVTWLQEVVE